MPDIEARDRAEVLAVLTKLALDYALNYRLDCPASCESILEGYQHYLAENVSLQDIRNFLRQCR